MTNPLLDEIEIRRFRSLDRVRMRNLRDMNVVFGKNDAGKSNVLRALNLFFNGETDIGRPFDWAIDHTLGSEISTTYVKVTFHVPDTYWRSCGRKLTVRRQWNSKGETTQTVGRRSAGKAPPSNIITRFLRLFHYHHIPAIKDSGLFEHLLGATYAILVEDAGFKTLVEEFAATVQGHTTALSKSLETRRGLKSLLSGPTDLRVLFRSLDFLTGGDTKFSLLLQRGDGIKVTHIPELLDFISERSATPYHIWGFEEPENSLSYSNAISEADRLQEASANPHRQVFVTSHSPAFYGLSSASVSRFCVSR
ncbi:ATP-dependent endonuclease, partial [Planctomycetota bacterium]